MVGDAPKVGELHRKIDEGSQEGSHLRLGAKKKVRSTARNLRKHLVEEFQLGGGRVGQAISLARGQKTGFQRRLHSFHGAYKKRYVQGKGGAEMEGGGGRVFGHASQAECGGTMRSVLKRKG